MGGTFETAPLREEECPRCGSVYQVRVGHLSLASGGSFDCLVCRREITVPDDAARLRYILIKVEPWPKLRMDRRE